MKTNGTRTNKSGKTYPESSARQALRNFRRAQGGPGITTGKNPTSVYVQDPKDSLSMIHVSEVQEVV